MRQQRHPNFRVPTKNLEEEEAERKKKEHEQRLNAKQDLLEKEFEKVLLQQYKSEENSDDNLNKLRGLLDIVTESNSKKIKDLENIDYQTHAYELQEDDSMTNRSFQSGKHSLRGTSVSFRSSMQTTKVAELEEQEFRLKNSLEEIEELQSVENHTQSALENKAKALYHDNIIYQKRVNELLAALDHAAERFKDLQPVELTAETREAAAWEQFKAIESKTKQMHDQDTKLRSMMDKLEREEHQMLEDSKKELSEVLIKIDEYRQLKEQQEKKIEELENYNLKMIEQKANSEQISAIIEILDQLDREYIDANDEVHSEDLSDSVDRPDLLKLNSERSNRSKRPNSQRKSSRMSLRRSTVSPESFTPQKTGNDPSRRGTQLAQTITKHHLLLKILAFSRKHEKGGISHLADRLIWIFQNFSQREMGLKTQYEELSEQKLRKDREMGLLKKELAKFKAINKEITLTVEEPLKQVSSPTNRFKFLNRIGDATGRSPATDAGVISFGKAIATINQLMAEGVQKTIPESLPTNIEDTQYLILFVYSSMVEILMRLSNLLQAADTLSFNGVPDSLLKFGQGISETLKSYQNHKIQDFLKGSSAGGAGQTLEVPRALHFNLKEENKSDVAGESSTETLSSDYLKTLFVKLFGGFEEQANQFDLLIQNDMFIKNFVPPKFVIEYLKTYSMSKIPKAEAVKKVIANLNSLTEEGSNLLLDRIDKICEGYVDLIEKLSQTQKETTEMLLAQTPNLNVMPSASETSRSQKFALPEKLKQSQELQALKLCKYRDLRHPKRNLAEEEAQLATQENFESAKQELKEKRVEHDDDEKLKKKLKGISLEVLEKRRGNYYKINKIHYPYKTKLQIENEAKTDHFTIQKKVDEKLSSDQREKNYFENERDTIRKGELETRLNFGKEEPVPKKEIEAISRALQVKDSPNTIAKRKMIENSQLLSQINLVASEVNNEYYRSSKYRVINNLTPEISASPRLTSNLYLKTHEGKLTAKNKSLQLSGQFSLNAKSAYPTSDTFELEKPSSNKSDKSYFLPKVHTHRPTTSENDFSTRSHLRSEPSISLKHSIYYAEKYAKKPGSNSRLSTFRKASLDKNQSGSLEAELILPSPPAKKKNSKKLKSSRSTTTDLRGPSFSSTETATTQSKRLFNEPDPVINDYFAPSFLGAQHLTLSDDSYKFDPYNIRVPSLLVEGKRD